MASVQDQRKNCLLVTICNELSEEKFTVLLGIYNVRDDNLSQVVERIDALQDLDRQGILDLKQLAQNLEVISCQDQSDKVTEYIKETEASDVLRCRQNTSASEREIGALGHEQSQRGEEDVPAERPTDIDQTCMERAILVSKESPDKNVKVGSVLYRPNTNETLATGFNRLPRGFNIPILDNQVEPEEPEKAKYYYVLHSAIAAFIQATGTWKKSDLEGCILYTTLFPANNNAQLILEYGIKEVVYLHDLFPDRLFTTTSKRMLREGKVKVRVTGGSPREIPRQCYYMHKQQLQGFEDQPWPCPEEDKLQSKYYFVLHSAVNVIVQATKKANIEGSVLYTTLFPAYKDTQLIVKYGIKELVYLDDIYKDEPFTITSKQILKKANIKVRRLDQKYFKDPPVYRNI